jgi:hypothetical protein
MGTRLSHEHIVELALSGEVTVMWRYDFADGAITWMAGTDELLGATPHCRNGPWQAGQRRRPACSVSSKAGSVSVVSLMLASHPVGCRRALRESAPDRKD